MTRKIILAIFLCGLIIHLLTYAFTDLGTDLPNNIENDFPRRLTGSISLFEGKEIKRRDMTMVLIIDGNSEIGAQEQFLLFDLFQGI